MTLNNTTTNITTKLISNNTTTSNRILSSIRYFSPYTQNSLLPGIIILSAWAIYLLSISLYKFTRRCQPQNNNNANLSCILRNKKKKKEDENCCFCYNLGGSLSPQQFYMNMEGGGEEDEDDVQTILEDDDIYVQGLRYDKYRFDTLRKQMKKIRRMFMILGVLFLTLSIPTTMMVMYYSFIYTTIYDRVSIMEYRMDSVRSTTELLLQKRVELITMTSEIVMSLSDTTIRESCLQGNITLLDASNDVIISMSNIEIEEQDLYQIKESVIDAADVANEMSQTLNIVYTIIWLTTLTISCLNIIVIMLIFGSRAARRGKCKPNHKLVYNCITFNLFSFFITLLWVSVAAVAMCVIVNKSFCGGDTNQSLLTLLSSAGYEYSLFYYFTSSYIEGCGEGVKFGSSISTLLETLRSSITGNHEIQSLMSSVNSCASFSSLYDQIDAYNNKFESVLAYLNSATYILHCDNVNHWYVDLTSRATCTDMPAFSIAALTLMFISALIVSVMVTMNVAIRSDMDLFLEINSNDDFNDEKSEQKKTAIVIGESRRNLFLKTDAEINKKTLESYFVPKRPGIGFFRRRNKKSIEQLKQDLEKVYSEREKTVRNTEEMSQVSTLRDRSRSVSPVKDELDQKSTNLTYRGSSTLPRLSPQISECDDPFRETSSFNLSHLHNVSYETPSRKSAKKDIETQLQMQYKVPISKAKVTDFFKEELEKNMKLKSHPGTNNTIRERSRSPGKSSDYERNLLPSYYEINEPRTPRWSSQDVPLPWQYSPQHSPQHSTQHNSRDISPPQQTRSHLSPRNISPPPQYNQRNISPSRQTPFYQQSPRSTTPPRQYSPRGPSPYRQYSPRSNSPSQQGPNHQHSSKNASPNRQYSPRSIPSPQQAPYHQLSPRNASPYWQHYPRSISPPTVNPIDIKTPSQFIGQSSISPSHEYSPIDESQSYQHIPRDSLTPFQHNLSSASHQCLPSNSSGNTLPIYQQRSITSSNQTSPRGRSPSRQLSPNNISPVQNERAVIRVKSKNHNSKIQLGLSSKDSGIYMKHSEFPAQDEAAYDANLDGSFQEYETISLPIDVNSNQERYLIPTLGDDTKNVKVETTSYEKMDDVVASVMINDIDDGTTGHEYPRNQIEKPRIVKKEISWSDQPPRRHDQQNSSNAQLQNDAVSDHQIIGAFDQRLQQLQQGQQNSNGFNQVYESENQTPSYSLKQPYTGEEHISQNYLNANNQGSMPIISASASASASAIEAMMCNQRTGGNTGELQLNTSENKQGFPVSSARTEFNLRPEARMSSAMRPSLKIGSNSRIYDSQTQTFANGTSMTLDNSGFNNETTRTFESHGRDSKPYKLRIQSESSDTTSFDSYSSRGRQRNSRDSTSSGSYSTRSYSTRSRSTRPYSSRSGRSSYYTRRSHSTRSDRASYYARDSYSSDSRSYTSSDYSDSDSSYYSRRGDRSKDRRRRRRRKSRTRSKRGSASRNRRR